MSNFTFPDPFRKNMEIFQRMSRAVSRTNALRPQIRLAQMYNKEVLPELNSTLEISRQLNKIYRDFYFQLNKPILELAAQLSKIQTPQILSVPPQVKLPVLNISTGEKILREIENDDSIIEEAVSNIEKIEKQDFSLQQSFFTFQLLDQLLDTLNTGRVKYPKTTYVINDFSKSISDFYEQMIYEYLFSKIFGSLPTGLVEQMPLIFINILIGLIVCIGCQKLSK
ncbi:hypothetical protein [Staphylococcus delphini]|uniref:Uncharacterized protein n=1 Tax=Staphylococcus delphini TaxID=53344 RepID=A0AAX0QU30_9STAP|nr:hypothetical protein [Staphylococcus delphini]PCF50100.1 hypothetical protein B5C07_07790 [Staphylococcus delphini]PNZ95721.1 hypothetical protein CD148_03330 [Staphylococcus delphini]RIZ56268.1 hypothetical protein CDL68_01635 [Staphylococcus delphini]VED62500.1 Uncharacterised protein [Staphylococcus delphini]